jgi:hypothetical protein
MSGVNRRAGEGPLAWKMENTTGNKGMETVKDLAVEVREYAVPNDFSNWKDHDTFETAFTRHLRDLRAEETKKT